MSSKRDKALTDLETLMDAYSEPLREISDKELLEEATGEGVDTKQAVDEVQKALDHALAVYQKQRLVRARRQYEQSKTLIASTPLRLPTAYDEKLALLTACVARHGYLKTGLTAQYRDFRNLTERDLDGMLQQLHALGLLDRGDEEIKG